MYIITAVACVLYNLTYMLIVSTFLIVVILCGIAYLCIIKYKNKKWAIQLSGNIASIIFGHCYNPSMKYAYDAFIYVCRNYVKREVSK